VLNDRYCSVTLSQSKFKHKNVHEDLLFKNEDDMYSYDHVILQLETVVNNLQKEAVNATNWDNLEPAEKEKVTPYKTKFLSRVTLAFIDKFYSENVKMPNPSAKVTENICKSPSLVIASFHKRLRENLDDARIGKQLRLDEWKQCCESNFLKSLDHRSFFFKES
jgi:histone deacetylase complex regulatory component SIN3